MADGHIEIGMIKTEGFSYDEPQKIKGLGGKQVDVVRISNSSIFQEILGLSSMFKGLDEEITLKQIDGTEGIWYVLIDGNLKKYTSAIGWAEVEKYGNMQLSIYDVPRINKRANFLIEGDFGILEFASTYGANGVKVGGHLSNFMIHNEKYTDALSLNMDITGDPEAPDRKLDIFAGKVQRALSDLGYVNDRRK